MVVAYRNIVSISSFSRNRIDRIHQSNSTVYSDSSRSKKYNSNRHIHKKYIEHKYKEYENIYGSMEKNKVDES